MEVLRLLRFVHIIIDLVDFVAQQVEHIPFKDGAMGSNPIGVTNGPVAQLDRATVSY